jgi:hypothetical protein
MSSGLPRLFAEGIAEPVITETCSLLAFLKQMGRHVSSGEGMTRLSVKLLLRLGCLWISACFIGACYGQAITATVEGIISDAGGAGVSGAAVKVENTATGISRSGLTDSSGRYEFTALNPGAYQITVEASGFSKKVLTGVVLQVSQEARVDIQLQVGQVVDTVMVQATGALLETETSSNGTVIDNKKVVELPLSNRQF